MSGVRIAGRTIGGGHPCLVVAEAGINHNGDVDAAHRMVDSAAAAGADALKVQNYRTEDFLSDVRLEYAYEWAGGKVVESQQEMFKRCELAPDVLQDLRDHCAERGLLFLGTPSGQSGIDDLVRVEASALKNGSDYMTHLPMVESMARTGLPTILSAGMATLAEVDDAVRAFRGAGGHALVLLHCTSTYPTPPADAHLRKMVTLAYAFGCPVGLSDHTEGTIVAVAAVALGACMLEKHFTLDGSLPGPDHRFSSDPTEFAALVKSVRAAEVAIGSPTIGPTASETSSRVDFRLSCVAAGDLVAGHRLAEADIVFRRPGTGLAPREAPLLVGRQLARGVERGTVLTPDLLA